MNENESKVKYYIKVKNLEICSRHKKEVRCQYLI